MDNTSEHITHEVGIDEAWICICRNTPDADGLFTCDSEGNEVEPAVGWDDLYVCAKCGRIIKQKTLEVVGRSPSPKLLAFR